MHAIVTTVWRNKYKGVCVCVCVFGKVEKKVLTWVMKSPNVVSYKHVFNSTTCMMCVLLYSGTPL